MREGSGLWSVLNVQARSGAGVYCEVGFSGDAGIVDRQERGRETERIWAAWPAPGEGQKP